MKKNNAQPIGCYHFYIFLNKPFFYKLEKVSKLCLGKTASAILTFVSLKN